MKLRQPRTILQLILGGFTVAIVPLVSALLIAQLNVRNIAESGQTTVIQATEAVQAARSLVDRTTSMERNIRQYLILEDPQLLESYKENRTRMYKDLGNIQRLFDNPSIHTLTEMIRKEEQSLDNLLVEQRLQEVENSLDHFANMISYGRGILYEISQVISHDIQQIQNSTSAAQNAIFWLIAALIPTVLGLTALFIALIVKPLRQIDHVIRRMGGGRFKHPIAITGPQDLVELGNRLEWMRQRLIELEDQKREFLRHMSHELKTPLTAIREGSDLLGSGVTGRLTEEQKEIAGLIANNTHRLQRQIEDLLNYSRSYSHPAQMEYARVRYDEEIRSVVNDYKLSSKSKNLHFHIDLVPIILYGDAEKLNMLVNNLVSNAVKYSPENGIIRVILKRKNMSAVLDICDQGPGIDIAERDQIFEPFFQGNTPHSSHIKGSGIGLAITRNHAELHKGQVDVIESTRGAHIRVTLPLSQDEIIPEHATAV